MARTIGRREFRYCAAIEAIERTCSGAMYSVMEGLSPAGIQYQLAARPAGGLRQPNSSILRQTALHATMAFHRSLAFGSRAPSRGDQEILDDSAF